MTGQTLAVAVPTAVIAAVCFGVSAALQQRSTHSVRAHATLRFGLLLDLLRQPLWLASIGLDLLGVCAQGAALATGSVALVQPLQVTSLIFAVLAAAWLTATRVDKVLVWGCALCGVGLAVFLALARPSGGIAYPTVASMLPVSIGIVVVVFGCLVAAARYTGRVRALALATASGILYGVTAGLGKIVLDSFGHGVLAPFTQWPLYALVAVGIVGFLLNQNALQTASTIAGVFALITIMDPLAGIAVGIGWLRERVSATPGAVTAEVLAVVIMVLGVVVLARRSPAANTPRGRDEVTSGYRR